jgi:CubicO group peptidase (beta-lactamase class C family)
MKHLTYLGQIILAALCIAGCESRRHTSTLQERIDSLSGNYLTTDGPGGAVLVAVGDSVVFAKGYGMADLATKEKITTKTLFNLGSISKTFVANTIPYFQQREDYLLKMIC